jgi:nicotinate phosphoribosyltransferase
MKYKQIILSMLDNDFYKFNMGQMFLHSFTNIDLEWTYKNQDKSRKFTKAMVDEIDDQIKEFCKLRFKKEELDYLKSIPWIKPDYIDFLSLYKPLYRHFSIKFNEKTEQLDLTIHGPQFLTTYYETPVMSIISEVWFRMSHTEEEYAKLEQDLFSNTDKKIHDLNVGHYILGNFSEFGTNNRFSRVTQEEIVRRFTKLNTPLNTFVGTSNVFLAMIYGIKAVGTMSTEAIISIGQGFPERNPAYSNKFMMEAWHKEFGTDNGIYLTAVITTDCFLKDFTKSEAELFDGVRHDSGDPYVWGEKMISCYEKYNIDTHTKTLLFSYNLNFEEADKLNTYFKDRIGVAFSIGTYLTNDHAMNQVLAITAANNIPVCKLGDSANTNLPVKSIEYLSYLRRTIDWRLFH